MIHHMRTLLASFLFTALLTGCATNQPLMSELKPIAKERHFAANVPIEGGASVTLLRDQSFAGSAVDYRILIDGRLSAQLAWGEFVVMHVPSGERVIELRHPSATLGAIGDSTTLRAEPAAKYFYRITSDVGQMRLLRTTAESVGLAK